MKVTALAFVVVAGCGGLDEDSVMDEVATGPSKWTTVEDHPGVGGAAGLDIAIVSAPPMLVVGREQHPAGLGGWMVRISNSGFGWGGLFPWQLSAGHDAEAERVVVDASGRIFISGFALDINDQWHWITRSGTSPATLVTVDDQMEPVGGAVLVEGMVVYRNYVVVLAREYTLTGGDIYRMRYSQNSGVTWADLVLPPTMAWTALCATSNGIVGVGSSTTVPWVVVSNSDPAVAPWTTIDSFVSRAGFYTPTACAEVGTQIVVAGTYALRAPFGGQGWIVRAGSPGAWSFVDNYPTPYAVHSEPFGVAVGSSGRLYVTGRVAHSATSPYQTSWHTRESIGGTWTDSDDIVPLGSTAVASAITASSLGTFVTGQVGGDMVVRGTP